jgi:two-component system response regulator
MGAGAEMESNRLILLVEDNPDDVELTLRALKKGSICAEVVIARDGAEALDYLFGTGPHAGRDPSLCPALVLLDLKLPKVDGIEVLRRLRAHPATALLPVVVLTLSNEESDIRSAYRFGANSYLRKPVDFDRFNDVLAQLSRYWLEINEPPPLEPERAGEPG